MAVDGKATQTTGGGLFEAPICTRDFAIRLDEGLALLEFRTIERSVIRVPIPVDALADLAARALDAHGLATEF